MTNHPIPRPASSREADDDQLDPGSFQRGRCVVFVAALVTLVVLPEDCAKRFLGIIAVSGITFALASFAWRRNRHG